MASIIGFILGLLWGGWVAKKRGGNRMDIAQYAVVHGIVLGLVALLVSVLVMRMGWI
jgi:hypothetical protein